MNSSLCAIILFLSSAVYITYAQESMNLVPHEQHLFETLNGATEGDVDALRAHYDKDAYIAIYSGQKLMASGDFDEIIAPKWRNLEHFATKWQPVTHTDAKHPENGAFALAWTHYGKTRNGLCDGMYSGFSVVKFNKRGRIISDISYSGDIDSAWGCFDEISNTNTQRKNL